MYICLCTLETGTELTSEIEAILNGNETETEYGPPINQKVVTAFVKLIGQVPSKEQMEKSRSDFKPPSNGKELGVPKVNPEIWHSLPRKAQTADATSQHVQQFLSRSLVAQCKLAEILADNSTKIPKDLLKQLLTVTMDGATQTSSAFREISIRRRQQIKPYLSPDCTGLCSPAVPITDQLFGNNLEKDITATKATAKVMKSVAPPTHQFTPRNQFNQFNARGSGNQRYLNFRRPSRNLTRGGRRPFRGRSQNYQ